jgi:hypothetical protein
MAGNNSSQIGVGVLRTGPGPVAEGVRVYSSTVGHLTFYL